MAVHLSIGRNLAISLVALVGLALVTGADHFLSRPVPPGEGWSAAEAQPRLGLRPQPRPGPAWRIRHRAWPWSRPGARPAPETEAVVVAGAEVEVAIAAEPETEAVVVAGAEVEVAIALAPAAALAAPPATAPAADAVQTASDPAAAPTVAPSAVTEPAVPRRRPSTPPVLWDPVQSTSRPKNLAPIPTRAPRADTIRVAVGAFAKGEVEFKTPPKDTNKRHIRTAPSFLPTLGTDPQRAYTAEGRNFIQANDLRGSWYGAPSDGGWPGLW